MKKLLKGSLFILLTVLLMAACGGMDSVGGNAANNTDSEDSASNGDAVTLSLYSTLEENERPAFEEVVADFEESNPGVHIDINYPGTSYEDELRVRMGANNMPDLFDTHGWAILRYGEYTENLDDMDWVEHFDPALEPILKDEEGKVYAYPLNQAKDGVMYNENVLEEYGVEPPSTVDEFTEALETIKEKSGGEVTPLWIPANDQNAIGQILDQFSTPLLVTAEDHNFEAELLDGTFDWSQYTPLLETVQDWKERGLINEDAISADPAQRAELMAQNLIAFTFTDASIGPVVTDLNPEVQVGNMPTPAFFEGDDPSWIGGERRTLAVSNQSNHIEEAKMFIDFIAQPENAEKIAAATQLPAGLVNVNTGDYFEEYFDLYGHIDVQPYFDRVYLPSGMWDVYGTTGQELLSGTMTPEQVTAEMESEYHRLRE